MILWRAGLRVQEALALTEADLDQRRGSLLVRRGKGGRRREEADGNDLATVMFAALEQRISSQQFARQRWQDMPS